MEQRFHGVVICTDTAVQNVVSVRGNNQFVDWQAHTTGQITGKNIAKITCWHSIGQTAHRPTQGQRRIKIIDDLSHDARPVNRVHRNQLTPFWQKALISKCVFYKVLAVVKVTLHRQVEDIIRQYSRHLSTLYLRYSLVGM